MTLQRAELLEAANVAYNNIIAIGVGEPLATAGFGEEKRQEGLQLAAGLQAKLDQQQAAKGHQIELTQEIQVALSTCQRDMTALKRAIRTADRIGDSALYTRLNLKGRQPKSYSGFVTFAKTTYNSILADEEILQAISGLNYPQERITALLQGISNLEALNLQQEQAKGTYRGLTQEIKAPEKALRDNLKILQAIVNTIFSGEELERVIKSLQLAQA